MKSPYLPFNRRMFVNVLILGALMSLISFCASAQSKKQAQIAYIQKMIKDKRFTFVAEYVGTMHKFVNNYYFVQVDPDSLTASLRFLLPGKLPSRYVSANRDSWADVDPYIYFNNQVYSSSQGIPNTAYDYYYQIDSTKKGKYVIKIAPRGTPLNAMYVLTVNARGNAFLAVYLNKTLVSYYDGLITNEPEKYKERIMF